MTRHISNDNEQDLELKYFDQSDMKYQNIKAYSPMRDKKQKVQSFNNSTLNSFLFIPDTMMCDIKPIETIHSKFNFTRKQNTSESLRTLGRRQGSKTVMQIRDSNIDQYGMSQNSEKQFGSEMQIIQYPNDSMTRIE